MDWAVEHAGGISLVCDDCGYCPKSKPSTKVRKKSLTCHIQLCEDLRRRKLLPKPAILPMICDYCGFSPKVNFKFKCQLSQGLTQHIEHSHPIIPRPPKPKEELLNAFCDDCDFETPKMSGKRPARQMRIAYHYFAAHSVINLSQKVQKLKYTGLCDLCGHSLSSKQNMFGHWETHEFERRSLVKMRKQYSCDVCGFSAHDRYAFFIHWIKYHEQNLRILDICNLKSSARKRMFCDICSKQYNMADQLYSHSLNHFPRKSMPSKCTCDICGRILKEKVVALRHIRHCHNFWQTEPFHCDLCSFIGRFRLVMTRHLMRVHATISETFRYWCDACDYKVYQGIQIRNHWRKVHGLGLENTKFQKPSYYCDVCGNKHSHLNELASHIGRHHNVALPDIDIVCDVCFSNLSTKSALTGHLRFAHPLTNFLN